MFHRNECVYIKGPSKNRTWLRLYPWWTFDRKMNTISIAPKTRTLLLTMMILWLNGLIIGHCRLIVGLISCQLSAITANNWRLNIINISQSSGAPYDSKKRIIFWQMRNIRSKCRANQPSFERTLSKFALKKDWPVVNHRAWTLEVNEIIPRLVPWL